MKEFSEVSHDEYSKGLRRFNKSRRMQGQFFDLFNLKPTQFGLVPFDPMIMPISLANNGLSDETFPFPQLFIGKKHTFILGRNRIFYVNPLDWTQLYQLTTYDAASPLVEKSIATGGSWEFIDFWDTWLFTNGVCTIFGSGQDTMLGNSFKVYVQDTVPVACGVDHKGRAIFGGFTMGSFWDSTWQTFWNAWDSTNQDTGISSSRLEEGNTVTMPIGDQWIWWSSIGGGDMLMLFYPTLFGTTGHVTTSGYDATKPIILDILKKNEQGFMPMPFQGRVTAIKPLGNFLIVYSTEGVAAIDPVVSPAPTYRTKNLQLGGISSRGAVAGDDKNHVYMDKSGLLMRIKANLEVEPLGYREYLFTSIGKDVLISHVNNPQNLDSFGEFYISDGSKNWGLTENGLFQHGQSITSAYYFQGVTMGLGSELYNPVDVVGRIGQDIIDFKLPGFKTIEHIRLVGRETLWSEEDSIALTVALDYRYKMGDDQSWNTTSYKGVNKEGVVTFPVTALEFRLRILICDYENLDIEYAEFSIKHGDKRYKRSVPISQAYS